MPNDAGQYLGQRLPDEILHYMSKGLINPRILQWRTTCQVFEVPPMDGGNSPEYKELVSSKLIPLRTPVVNLLSSSLHNWYRHQSLHQTHWYSPVDPNGKRPSTTIPVEKPSEAQAPLIVDTWNVKEATFKTLISLPNRSLRKTLKARFRPLPKYCTTQYGDSLLYGSMLIQRLII